MRPASSYRVCPAGHGAGMGVLFLMWNVPYAVALWHPLRHRISLYEALAMQAIGLLGESLIYLSLSPEPRWRAAAWPGSSPSARRACSCFHCGGVAGASLGAVTASPGAGASEAVLGKPVLPR